MPTSIRITKLCPGLALLLMLVACSPAATSSLTPTVTPDHSSTSNSCAFTAPPPTPTPGPPTPTPTPPPTSPFSEEDFPPYVERPPRPAPELPAAARHLANALVSIAIHPPSSNDDSAANATGLLVSPDGLVLTILDYTRPVGKIEVVLPDGATSEASIERVDARTGSTLLKLDLSDAEGTEGSGLPYSEIGGGDHIVSPGEPVLLVRRFSDGGEPTIQEGFAAPATNKGAGDVLFALLPIGSHGGNGDLVVNRDGNLLGMAGPGQWWGAGIHPHGGPPPGPPRPAVKVSSLLPLLEEKTPADAPDLPVAVSYHGQSWGRGMDSPVTRELLSGPAQKALQSLGGPVGVESLGQSPRSVLSFRPGTVLELVYPHPQELRSSEGDLLGVARYVAFWWDREGAKPDVVLCGAEPEHVGAAFVAGDLTEVKGEADSAPALGRSMVDVGPLPGYPSDYPLKWRVDPDQQTYHPGEEVEFIVTIENQSDWPMTVYHLPPALEVRSEAGPGSWWQHPLEDSRRAIPPHKEVKLVVPWLQMDQEGNPVPPGEYTIGAATHRIRRAGFTIMEDSR